MMRKFVLISIGICLLLLTFHISPVESQSADDIAKQIQDEQAKLEETVKNIQSLEQQLADSKNALEIAETGVPYLEAKIKEVETQIEVNKAKLQLLQKNNKVKELQAAQRKLLQKSALSNAYIDWKSNNGSTKFNWMLLNDDLDAIQIETLTSTALGNDNKSIDKLLKELYMLNSEIESSEQLALNLQDETKKLESQKVDFQNQIGYLTNTISTSASQIGSLMDQQASIQKNIATLTAEQQKAAAKEAEILRQKQAEEERLRKERESKPRDLTNGKFYFSGFGRDLYQGHGVGLSQWGAHGAGLSGMSAEQIITFYYTQVSIETRPGSVEVIGVGTLDSNDYVAGIGEVPDKACGTDAQVRENPLKYAFDNPEYPFDCWPEESIKAQVIAARSYALSYGGPICNSASCQLYHGGEGKRWAADETKDMVIVSSGATESGQIIKAVYSADNNQGYGTANNDTIFQNIYGDGTAYSYLRAVNDSSFATPSQWTNWNYQTNTYTYEDILAMLQFIATGNSDYDPSTKAIAAQMVSSIGSITGISFERDSSERVKKVIIQGTNGTVSIGGWWFKNFWNTWRDSVGDADFIFSQRFYLATQ